MNYRYLSAYWLKGAILQQGVGDVDVVAHERNRLRAILTSQLDKHCFEVDQGISLANLILNAGLRESAEGEMNDRLVAEVTRIREERVRKFGGSSLYLVIQVEGKTDYFAATHQRDFDEFSIYFDGASKEPIKAAAEEQVIAVINAVAIAVDNVLEVKKACEAVTFYREDGKPIYSYTFHASGSAYVSNLIQEDAPGVIKDWYEKAMNNKSLGRVSRLLVSSLQTMDDPLRSFLSAWAALEIFANKTFGMYERRLFEELNEGNHPKAREKYLERIQGVMKDKYRLTDKFALISSQLCPSDADEDLQNFEAAKSTRDALLHGQDVSEEVLPTQSVQKLTRKYLGLHLGT